MPQFPVSNSDQFHHARQNSFGFFKIHIFENYMFKRILKLKNRIYFQTDASEKKLLRERFIALA